jgi:formylmethanofuran dehydrogenase subunit E
VRNGPLLIRPWLLAVLCALGCNSPHGDTPHAGSDVDAKLAEVAHIHGGAGAWAVAGYRMGERALRELGVPKKSFDLEVVHFTPPEVQYSCIADGAAAATGASAGKLNLTLADASAPETRTVYRRKSTGKSITLRVTAGFASRFANVPRERLDAAGREVMSLRDDEIFEVVP